MARIPLIEGARNLAPQGLIKGASGRNWSAYGHEIQLDSSLDLVDRHLLTDPQSSGGLLVTCTPEAVADEQAVFQRHGFADAADIGCIEPVTDEGIHLRVR